MVQLPGQGTQDKRPLEKDNLKKDPRWEFKSFSSVFICSTYLLCHIGKRASFLFGGVHHLSMGLIFLNYTVNKLSTEALWKVYKCWSWKGAVLIRGKCYLLAIQYFCL